MKEVRYYCNGCKIEVASEGDLQSFYFKTPLTTGRVSDGILTINDRCVDCAKPIYEAMRKLHNKHGDWKAPK